MKNYIIECNKSDENVLVQIKILEAGYSWSEGKKYTQYTDKPVIIFDNLNNKERSISYHNKIMSEDYRKWSCYSKHKRISAEDFLNMKTF